MCLCQLMTTIKEKIEASLTEEFQHNKIVGGDVIQSCSLVYL